MSAKQKSGTECTWQCVKVTALTVSLVISAMLMAMVVASTACSWLAWFGLLPLFWAIRVLRPLSASLAGALWGICFYLFSASGPTPAISPTFQSLGLLVIVPMLYACCGVLLTRLIGFNPLLLAIGWILVEITLQPLGLHQGLLAGTQSQSPVLHWVSRLLGYAFVAFLVACVNASLVVILSNARLRVSCRKSLAGLPNSEAHHLSQTLFFPQLITIFQEYPRPPPLVAGRAHCNYLTDF